MTTTQHKLNQSVEPWIFRHDSAESARENILFIPALCLLALFLVHSIVPVAKAQFDSPSVESGAASINAAPKLLLYEFFDNKTMNSKMVREQIIKSGPASEIIKESYQLIPVERGKAPEKETFYKITRYPTLIIALLDGTEVDRIIGFPRPDEAAEILKAAAAGQSKIARYKEDAAAPGAGIREHLALVAALRMRDDPAGALREYAWILDNGETADPRLYSSLYRLMIQQLASLGKSYPSALEDLKMRRDAAVSAASGDAPTPVALERVFIMNEALGATALNIPLYLKIPGSSPLKQKLFPGIFLTLVREKKYQEAASVANLEVFVGLMYPRFLEGTDHHANSGHGYDRDHGQRASEQKITIYTSAACETLIALGEVEKAKRVAGHALDFLGKDNRNLITRLNAAATRSGGNATDFIVWLTSCTQPAKPKSP